MELVNFDPEVMDCIRNLFNTECCAVVAGQLALDLMSDPPKPGDPSFPMFSEVDANYYTIIKMIYIKLNL